MAKKKIKGWTILLEGKYIAYDGNGKTLSLAIYSTKADAKKRNFPFTDEDFIKEIEISYSLPKKLKKK